MTDRIPVRFGARPSAWQRTVLFLGHYDARIYLSERSYLDIGAGSWPCLLQASLLSEAGGLIGSHGSIGRWCEFSLSSEVMGRGEHDHDHAVNVSFGGLRQFVQVSADVGMKPAVPIKIGHGVVISAGAKVLTGVSVGDGAVIGANAVATRDVPALAIVAGAPARVLRYREDVPPWWNFSTAYLIANMDNIQAVARGAGPHDWRVERPRFAIRKTGDDIAVLGLVDGDGVRPLSEAPASVRAYLIQAFGQADTYYWLADCWAD